MWQQPSVVQLPLELLHAARGEGSLFAAANDMAQAKHNKDLPEPPALPPRLPGCIGGRIEAVAPKCAPPLAPPELPPTPVPSAMMPQPPSMPPVPLTPALLSGPPLVPPFTPQLPPAPVPLALLSGPPLVPPMPAFTGNPPPPPIFPPSLPPSLPKEVHQEVEAPFWPLADEQIGVNAESEPRPCFPPGLLPPAASHGSLLHDLGQCRPCAWFWKPRGCRNERDCSHCHVCPPGELKARKKRSKQNASITGLVEDPVLTEQDGCLLLGPPPGLSTQEADSESLSGSEKHLRTTSAYSLATTASPGESDAASEGSGGQHDAVGRALPSDDPTSESENSLAADLVPPPGLMPSLGSIEHGVGTCHPCAWFWRPAGCRSGAACSFCHLCPAGELKMRKKQKQALARAGLAVEEGEEFPSPPSPLIF